MATSIPTTEINKLAAGAKILMLGTEMLIFLSAGDLMASPITPSGTPRISVPLNELPDHLSTRTFVFEDPKALEAYFCNTVSARPKATKFRLVPMHQFINNPLPTLSMDGSSGEGWTRHSPDQPPEVREFFKAMPFPYPSLEFVSIDQITYPEGREFITLNSDWRAACRAVPKGHKVEEITFDLAGSMKLNSSYVSRLVQLVSTILAVKAAGPFRCRLRDDEPYQYKDRVTGALANNGVSG